MKKRQIKRFFLTVPVVLGLSLVACGASGDVAGDGWRTSGVVAGSGTITHDGKVMFWSALLMNMEIIFPPLRSGRKTRILLRKRIRL